MNKDDLRAMLDVSKWSPANEKFVLEVRDQIINKAINKGRDIVVDDTNLSPKMERGIRKLVGNRATVEVIHFNTKLDVCLERNAKRTGTAFVPEDVIKKMAADWEKWKHVDCSAPGETEYGEFAPIEQDPGLDHCIIVDIDGTLARHVSRGPYDIDRVEEDELIEEVAQLVRMYKAANDNNGTVIIFSGRDDECMEATERWLNKHNIRHDGLYMRVTGDGRKDSIVKSEIFDAQILGKYYVDFVIDDRKQVKQMWVERGLFVLDVNQEDLYF